MDRLDMFSAVSSSVSISHVNLNLGNVINQIRAHDYLTGENKLQDLRQKVQQFFDTLKNERGNRVNIIIDELDRCSPQYAVFLLERIKHYLEDDNITFIFAINTRSLEKSIRHFYGNDIEGTRYLDRFFDMRMMLPPIHLERIIDQFDFGQNSVGKELCKSLAMKLDMSLRETLRYAKQYKTASGILTSQANGFYANSFQKWSMYYLPLAIAFQLTDMERFHSFISGDGKPDLHFIWECDAINRSLIRSFSNAPVQADSGEVNQEIIQGVEAYYENYFSRTGNNSIEVYEDYIHQAVRNFAFQTVGCFEGC